MYLCRAFREQDAPRCVRYKKLGSPLDVRLYELRLEVVVRRDHVDALHLEEHGDGEPDGENDGSEDDGTARR